MEKQPETIEEYEQAIRAKRDRIKRQKETLAFNEIVLGFYVEELKELYDGKKRN